MRKRNGLKLWRVSFYDMIKLNRFVHDFIFSKTSHVRYPHPCVLYCVFLICVQKGFEVGSNLFEFEKKLSEADSYLQILIDETKVLFHGDLTKNTTSCTLTCVKY